MQEPHSGGSFFVVSYIAGMFLQKKPKTSLAVAVFSLLLVTILLCIPGTKFPKITWLNKIWFDKWVHIGLFAMLVVAWCLAYSSNSISEKPLKNIFLRIAILGLLYGVIMELIQHFYIPFRSFDYGDIVADAVGCIGGYFFSGKYIKK